VFPPVYVSAPKSYSACTLVTECNSFLVFYKTDSGCFVLAGVQGSKLGRQGNRASDLQIDASLGFQIRFIATRVGNCFEMSVSG
jgi:hypothetical protein